MIDPRDLRTLKEVITWFRQVRSPLERLLIQKQPAKIPRMLNIDQIKPVKAPENGIPGRQGNIVSSVECDVITTKTNATTGDVEIITTTQTLEVFNQVTSDVMTNGERLGMAALHPDGRWWAIVDDCKDTGGS